MRARRERPDLVVLDLGLPEVDGLDVTRALRREADVPLIMLTARDSETDKVVGLELGADDYLTKPFSPRELVARVRAVLRRHARDGSEEQITVGDLTLDVPRLQATVAGQRVALTATEFELLATMARQPGRVFTRVAAAGRHPRPGARVLRAGDRRPRQEHPPQGGAGPAPSAVPAHRLRRRLPGGGCLSPNGGTAANGGAAAGARASARRGGRRASRGRRRVRRAGAGCDAASSAGPSSSRWWRSPSWPAWRRCWSGRWPPCSAPDREPCWPPWWSCWPCCWWGGPWCAACAGRPSRSPT